MEIPEEPGAVLFALFVIAISFVPILAARATFVGVATDGGSDRLYHSILLGLAWSFAVLRKWARPSSQ